MRKLYKKNKLVLQAYMELVDSSTSLWERAFENSMSSKLML